MPPRTHYARSGDLSIAYQVTGDGPIDLIFVPGWISHLDLAWEDPPLVRCIERLGRFCRLIRFDKRGTGLSDPVATAPTLEERMDDIRAVMEAVGIESAYFFSVSEGASMALLFAATYPERTQALVVYGVRARATAAPGYPWGTPQAVLDRMADAVDHWGEGRSLSILNPTLAGNPLLVDVAARREVMSASPAMVRALRQSNLEIDIRDILPTIRVPTLVLHRRDDVFPVDGARYVAEQIPEARFVALSGADHNPWLGDSDAILDEIETFFLGAPRRTEQERILATVLFTDIVGSTEHLARVGDRQWRDLLEDHDRLVLAELVRTGGRLVKHTGDGVLATFDGPARAVRCAVAICDTVRQLGIEIRAGLHTGECELIEARS